MHLELPAGSGFWVVADHHFGHRNIIRYCERPFGDVDEMRETLITRHNDVVGADDLVFLLGDLSMSGAQAWPVSRLNGRLIAVAGNHDEFWVGARGGPDHLRNRAGRYRELGCDTVVPEGVVTGVRLPSGREVLLAHLPYEPDQRDAEREHRLAPYRPADDGLPLICGHVHTTWRERFSAVGSPMVNVGVDVRDYRPTAATDIDRILDGMTGR
jgi:calcineurin-like phosphoesterase family protein